MKVVVGFSPLFGVAKSTISAFLRNKVMVKAADIAKGVFMITNQR